MKTNPMARGIRRGRLIMVCVALIGLTGGAFMLGHTLASRFGQYTGSRTEAPLAPNVSLADVMAVLPG